MRRILKVLDASALMYYKSCTVKRLHFLVDEWLEDINFGILEKRSVFSQVWLQDSVIIDKLQGLVVNELTT